MGASCAVTNMMVDVPEMFGNINWGDLVTNFIDLLRRLVWLPSTKSIKLEGDDDNKATIRLVMLSDTHGMHRTLDVPEGDVLIHAGDFTRYGKREDVQDFNVWLGTLPHRHKLVVNG